MVLPRFQILAANCLLPSLPGFLLESGDQSQRECVSLVIEYTVAASSLQSFHGTAMYRPFTPRSQNEMSLGPVPLTHRACPVDFVMLGIATIHLRRSWLISYSKYLASVTVRHPETL